MSEALRRKVGLHFAMNPPALVLERWAEGIIWKALAKHGAGQLGTRDELPAKGPTSRAYFWAFYDAADDLRQLLRENPKTALIEVCRHVATRFETHLGSPDNERMAENIKKQVGPERKGNGWHTSSGTVEDLLDRIETLGWDFDRLPQRNQEPDEQDQEPETPAGS